MIVEAPPPPVSLADARGADTNPADLLAVHDLITGPHLAAMTAAVRAASDKESRASLKRRLPGFIAAGLFDSRRADAWRVASGLLACDFDKVQDLEGLSESLAKDPSVALLFRSPSGQGIKAILRVPVGQPEPEEHRRAFAAAERWALEAHGAALDPSGKDPCRLAFLAHDPGAVLRLDAEPLDLERWAPVPVPVPAPAAVAHPPPRREAPAGDVVERAARYLDTLPPSIDGQNGHDALYRAAVAVAWGFDLPDGEALALLESYNQRAEPPWPAEELRRKLEEARRAAHKSPRGWLRDAPRREPVAEPARVGVAPGGESPSVDSAPAGTEAALAEHLAARGDLARRLRWDARDGQGIWREWSGTHWRPAGSRVPLSLQAAIRRALADGLEARTLDGRSIARLESAAGMSGVGSLLAAYPGMRMPAECDPPGMLATPGGVIDARSGECLPHDSARPLTRCLPVSAGPPCPLFDLVTGHLRACAGALFPAVHRFLGSALLGLGADRRLVWLVGPGGDGKSSLLRALSAALGDACGIVPAEALTGRGGRGAHAHELAGGMIGALLACATEVPGEGLDWPRIKALSGGDEQRSKRLNARAVQFRPPCLAMVSNEKPRPPDRAAAERLIVVQLEPIVEPDERLVATLKTPGPERDAIAGACLSWLLGGAAAYLAEGGCGAVPVWGVAEGPLGDWYDAAVARGSIRPGSGWEPLASFRALLRETWTAGQCPGDHELAAFLRGRLRFRRANSGRVYGATMGDA